MGIIFNLYIVIFFNTPIYPSFKCYPTKLQGFFSYSRHKTRNKSFFTTFEDFSGGNVSFGDGSIAQVRHKGTVTISGWLKLNNVLFGGGIKANFLSINQTCDSNHNVKILLTHM